MIENNNVFISSNNRSFRKAPMAAALVLAAGVSSPVMAEVSFESDNGWKASYFEEILY